MVAGLISKPRASCTRWIIASRERSECEVTVADSQSDACTGILPYGVEGEIAASLAVSKELSKYVSVISLW